MAHVELVSDTREYGQDLPDVPATLQRRQSLLLYFASVAQVGQRWVHDDGRIWDDPIFWKDESDCVLRVSLLVRFHNGIFKHCLQILGRNC